MIYRKSHSGRKKHDARTLPVKGRFEDKDVYFRCWNCGFINKDGREELAGDNAPDGAATFDYSNESQGTLDTSDSLNAIAVLDGCIDFYQVLLAAGQDGTAKPITANLGSTGTGCPLCHTRNWKGKN